MVGFLERTPDPAGHISLAALIGGPQVQRHSQADTCQASLRQLNHFHSPIHTILLAHNPHYSAKTSYTLSHESSLINTPDKDDVLHKRGGPLPPGPTVRLHPPPTHASQIKQLTMQQRCPQPALLRPPPLRLLPPHPLPRQRRLLARAGLCPQRSRVSPLLASRRPRRPRRFRASSRVEPGAIRPLGR